MREGGLLGIVLLVNPHRGTEGTRIAQMKLGSDEITTKTSAGLTGSSGAGIAKLVAKRWSFCNPILTELGVGIPSKGVTLG